MKTVTVTDYPFGTREQRILALANKAKHALFGGGCEPIADDVLIRAALAFDRLRQNELASTAIAGIAVMFSPALDADQSEETRRLLVTPLCDPAAAMAEAIANNRRLFGLDDQGSP